jgi:membrane associated rhomboid family serine protease
MSWPVFLLIGSIALISWRGFNDRHFFQQYMFQVGAILRGKEYLRMVSSGWLHGSGAHLAFNLIALWSFAGVVEQLSSTAFLMVVYALSLLGGSLTSLYVHRDNPHYSAIGASGAVSGVVFTSILLYPQGSIFIFFIPFPIPSWLFGIIYLFVSMYGMKKQGDNIGHEAHFGGALTGLIATTIWLPGIWGRFFDILF